MSTISNSLAQRIARQHGVVTVDQLIADGSTRHAVRRLVTLGLLEMMHQGVYRQTSAPETFEGRCAAACLADPTAVITGPAGARLWAFRHVFRPDQPYVLIAHDRTPMTRAVVLRRTNVLEPGDWVERDDGIRLANPVRTWFDCARDVNDERFERLTEWVIDHHATVPTLWATVRRMSARGRPGLARAFRVLSQRPAWQKPAGSALELSVLTALADRGVAGIVRQHPIRLSNNVVVHPDGALPDIKWAVEVDHVTWHGGRFDAQRDKGRDRQLRRLRWQVDRVTDQELRDDFAGTINELLELIGIRRRELAA